MDFHELLEERHSVRAYADKPVEKEKLERIIAAAVSAPSAGNLQAYKIVIVKDGKTKEALCRAALGQDSVLQAPVVLVFFADRSQSSRKYGERGASLYSAQDATIAAAYTQLEAANLGLGTVWIGAFEPEKVSEILGAEEGETPVAIIPIGYSAEKFRRPRIRREIWEMAREI